MGYKNPNKFVHILLAGTTTFLANTTYYFSNTIAPMTTNTGYRKLYAICISSFIRAIDFYLTSSNLPTTEDITVYIRVNDTTDYLIGTFNYTGASDKLHVTNYTLNIPLNRGDNYQIKMVMAAVFVTPAANVVGSGSVLVESE